MQLEEFIQDLIQRGKVTVAAQITPFSEEAIQRAGVFLQTLFNNNAQELTGEVPPFDAPAALWAACYLYRAVQFTLIRDAGEATVNQWLQPFTAPQTPAAILSVDLIFRYLPDLMSLAKGLAPEDVLVKRLQEAAAQWPLSSIGLSVNSTEDNINVILQHACLRQLYIDRIINTRDKARCNHTLVNEYLKEALGDHANTLWPGWRPQIKEA